MTERELERILAEESDPDVVSAAVVAYRAEHYRPVEDKQLICDLLCKTLQATRDQRDLVSLTYHKLGPDDEQVTIAWSEGGTSVNVSLDSGVAMIRDILKAIR
jgi:hypothetical protein